MRSLYVAAIVFVIMGYAKAAEAEQSSALDAQMTLCVQDAQSVKKANLESFERTTGTKLPGLDNAPSPITRTMVAECFFKLKRFAQARAEWQAYGDSLGQDSLILERLKYLSGLARADAALGLKAESLELIEQYYSTGHNQPIGFEPEAYLALTTGVDTPAKIANRRYWQSLSNDQRGVLTAHGGTSTWSEGSRPCHVSSFETQTATRQTWWYCAAFSSTRTNAYDFVNGKLVSAYTP
jgi:hypothetical protein